MSRARVDVTEGITLAYEDLGRGGRPLVLVHGFSGFGRDFESQWHALARHGRTLVPDLRGHGGSTHTGRAEDYRLDALAADLVGFLDALHLPAVDLLGHSMGGMLALRVALAAPGRVASLVLMNTSAGPLADLDREAAALGGRVAREHGMQTLANAMRARATQDPTRPVADRRVETELFGPERFWAWREARIVAMDPQAFEPLALAMADAPSLEPGLAGIRCPTTVIVGEEDAAFLAPSEALARGIPGAVRAWIPGAAHQPQHEAPEAWLAAVLRHLERVRSA